MVPVEKGAAPESSMLMARRGKSPSRSEDIEVGSREVVVHTEEIFKHIQSEKIERLDPSTD
jgi:hypothetical protein